jgi:hypothetical protein
MMTNWDLWGPADWRGDCITTYHAEDSTVTVDRADPRILISTELLDAIRQGDMPGAVMTMHDDVVTIHAANRTVVYRLRRDVPTPPTLVAAEWPD